MSMGSRALAADEPSGVAESAPVSPRSFLRMIEPKLDTSPGEDTYEPSQSRFTIKGGIEEKNLAIEWDDWHNKVAEAIMGGVFENFIEAQLTPDGVSAAYRFETTVDRHIKNVEIVNSSGNQWFNHLIVRAINKLDGNWVLSFPAGSKRLEVVSGASVAKEPRKGTRAVFGDTEIREADPSDEAPAPTGKSSKKRSKK